VNYVQITAGTPSKPLLKDTVPRGEIPVIHSQRSTLADLLEGGGTVLTRTIEALDRVNRVLSDQNIKKFSAMVTDAEAVTAELRQRKALIGDAQKALQDIDASVEQITKLTANANDMLNGDGRRTLKNAADAAEEAKQTAAQAHELLAKLQGPTSDFAANGLPQVTQSVIELQNSAQALQRLLNDIQSNPSGALGKSTGEEIKVKP
jgi:phospholipid/cholesterol/gamma-HCH transport system substrate-binding protein